MRLEIDLNIHLPYVFFEDKESIESFRKELPTYYIELDIENFRCYEYMNNMITYSVRCPSVDLNLI